MAGFLLALILVGSALHAAVSDEKKKPADSEVKYEGPVVYTNLPPPVLYFPNFPEQNKISNRGSAGDAEDKRIEYVPFPYKDLPLLVYKSDKQPPVHVVEKRQVGQDGDGSSGGQSSGGAGYQSGPAVYRAAGQYGNDHVDQHGVSPMPSGGMSTPVPAQSQQYISIGVSAIQQQQDQQQGIHQQQSAFYGPVQYSGGQGEDQSQYDSEGSQDGSAYGYYSSQQYSPQVPETQVQQPAYQLPQSGQSYMYQASQDSQAMPQGLASYGDKQMDGMGSDRAPLQHVGITIIRPGGNDIEDAGQQDGYQQLSQQSGYQQLGQQSGYQQIGQQSGYQQIGQQSGYQQNSQQNGYQQGGQQSGYQHGGQQSGYQQPVQMIPVQSQGGEEMSYSATPQFVSIGVFPMPEIPSNDYEQDSPPYYTEMNQGQNAQYQTTSGEYRPSFATSSGATQNQGPEQPNYQLISIDLSTLRNQQANQQSSYAGPSQQQAHQNMSPAPQRPAKPPQEMYGAKSQGGPSYGSGEKGIQQIVIQIPQNIAPEGQQKPAPQTSQQERPYRGTAQASNAPPSKMPPSPPAYKKPMYRPPPPPPGPPFGFPPAGINIAIIKQSDTVNVPHYRPPEMMPRPAPSSQAPVYHNRHPASSIPPPSRLPPPPHTRPRPFNSQGFRDHDMPTSANTFHPSNARFPPTSFRQHRSRQVPPPQGHEFYQSSTVHFSSAHPPEMRPPPFRAVPHARHPPLHFAHPSASVNHPQFIQMAGGGMSFGPEFAESSLQAISNNVTDDLDDVNFDFINAFLDPNLDFYGLAGRPNAMVQDPKKEEEKIIQKLTSEMMLHELNIATNQMAAGMQPLPPMQHLMGLMPHPMINPAMVNGPFPYRYWEQQPVGGLVDAHKIRGGLFSPYSHFQHPYAQGGRRPFGRFGKGRRKNRLGKGLKGKLASLRSSMRQKKITARQETAEEGTETEMQKIDKESASLVAAPRSTIIQTDGPGLDGIPIPLSPDHVLTSRMSTAEETKDMTEAMPPIIVYEGTKPPQEIYGTKEDIEGKNVSEKDGSAKDAAKDLVADESKLSLTADSSGYFNYMYSMLPDLIRDTLGRRHDGTGTAANWGPLEYALAEDQYDRNETSSPHIVSPIELETVPVSKNSSADAKSSLEAMIAETFSLLTKEEMSDILQ